MHAPLKHVNDPPTLVYNPLTCGSVPPTPTRRCAQGPGPLSVTRRPFLRSSFRVCDCRPARADHGCFPPST
eukprot:1192870-Prorocentrum_minimum.AAC.3